MNSSHEPSPYESPGPVEDEPPRRHAPPRWLSCLRLLRAPAAFTAVSDVLMGFFLTHDPIQAEPGLLALVAASVGVYLAGMVLNDVYDVEQDARERPWRPLPAGYISVSTARGLGFGLLLTGVLCGWAAGLAFSGGAAAPLRAGLIISALAALAWGYDVGLKRTPLGPVAMGGCRLLNVLLGMSLAGPSFVSEAPAFGFFLPGHICVACGFGVFIAGVTVLARRESQETTPVRPLAGLIIMFVGVAVIAGSVFLEPFASGRQMRWDYWLVIFGLLALSPLIRASLAAAQPNPARVQNAVRQSLSSLVIFAAAVVLLARGPTVPVMVILALLIPMTALSRLVSTT